MLILGAFWICSPFNCELGSCPRAVYQLVLACFFGTSIPVRVPTSPLSPKYEGPESPKASTTEVSGCWGGAILQHAFFVTS